MNVAKSPGSTSRRAAVKPDAEAGLRIRVFDADRTDRSLTFDEAIKVKPSARQLLWIDVEGELESGQRRSIVDRFDFDRETDRALAEPGETPHIQLHGQHFHLRVAAEPDGEHPEQARWLDIVAGPDVVITRHAEPLGFLEAINERIAADASIGELDSAEFVASVLDAIVTSYHAAVDQLEDQLDEIDAKALARPTASELFATLVAIRRRVGRLRRLLAGHRELFAALGRPDFGRGIASADPDVFLPVARRFEGALESLEIHARGDPRLVRHPDDAHRPAHERRDACPYGRYGDGPAGHDHRRVPRHERDRARAGGRSGVVLDHRRGRAGVRGCRVRRGPVAPLDLGRPEG